MRSINQQADAWDEYTRLQTDKVMLRKVNRLIKDIQRNGYRCSLGRSEMLRGDLTGFASVRIDKKNRLIFEVTENAITIVQCGGHYDDR